MSGSLTAGGIKSCLTRAFKKAYPGDSQPKPWQEDAIVQAALKWDDKLVRLFDHPRGSGKTKEIAMMSHVCLHKLNVRLVLLISDRKDLEQQLNKTAAHFLKANGHGDIVESCTSASHLESVIKRLEDDENDKAVVTVTLQSFPHVTMKLSKDLRDATAALADEAHRSHADKALSEELARVLGGPVHFLLYTGTASDRCLRLFGEREQRESKDGEAQEEAVEVCKPFHSVTEREVSAAGMIFELDRLQRQPVDVEVKGAKRIEAVAKKLRLKAPLMRAVRARAATSRAESIMMMKAGFFMQEFAAVREQLQGFEGQMMIVTASRRKVMDYVEACRAVAASSAADRSLRIYGAFSGSLALAPAGADAEEGLEVSEATYNKDLIKKYGDQAHRKAHILVVCDRFETGYDNADIVMVAVDKKVTSMEKLVQIYSRGNRKREGKQVPKIFDAANPRKDIERAINEYSVPRVCLASDGQEALADLSEKLSKLFEGLGEKRGAMIKNFAEWTPDARTKLAELLVPYLRRRTEGVSRGCASGLLSMKQAELAWKVLYEKHKGDVAPAAQKMKAIADLATKGCNLLASSLVDCGVESFEVTPHKQIRATEGPEETPAKLDQPSDEQLDKLRDDLKDFIVDDDEEEELAGKKSKKTLEEDVKTLARAKGHGRRSTFESLQRVALAAPDEATHEALVNAGAVEALFNLFLNGDRLEQSWSWKGLTGLKPASERVKTIVACREHEKLLAECTTLRQKELAAMKEIGNTLCKWQTGVTLAEKLEEQITEAKEQLAAKRAEKLVLGDFLGGSDDEDEGMGFGFGSGGRSPYYVDEFGRYKRRTFAQMRREQTQEGKRKLADAKIAQKLAVAALKAKVKELEASRSDVANDYAALRVLAVPHTLELLPDMCRGKFRAQARKQTLRIWKAMGKLDEEWRPQGSAAACAESVEGAKRKRSHAAGGCSVRDVPPALRALPVEVLRQVAKLGIVEDLLLITAGVQASEAAIECLRVLAPEVPVAKARVDLFDECFQAEQEERSQEERSQQEESQQKESQQQQQQQEESQQDSPMDEDSIDWLASLRGLSPPSSPEPEQPEPKQPQPKQPEPMPDAALRRLRTRVLELKSRRAPKRCLAICDGPAAAPAPPPLDADAPQPKVLRRMSVKGPA